MIDSGEKDELLRLILKAGGKFALNEARDSNGKPSSVHVVVHPFSFRASVKQETPAKGRKKEER